jgi:hypothetical protein
MVSSVLMYHRSYDYIIVILPVLWFWKERRWDKAGFFFLPGILFVGYVTFHYFYLTPGSQGIILFMSSYAYLTFVSLLWYLSILTLFFCLARPKSLV